MNDQEIANWLGMSKGYFSKGYSWARKLKETKAHSFLSESHIPSPSQKLKLRLHRLQRSYPILNAVSEQKLKALKAVKLNNNIQYIGQGFRITTKSIELQGIELWGSKETPASVLEAQAILIADNTVSALAEQYGLKTSLLAGSSPEGLMEIELTEHEMAERVEQKGIIPLHYGSITHKPDVWMDKSFGLGGLESNRVTYIQKLTDFTNDVVDNDAWNILKTTVPELAKTVLAIHEELKIHRKAYTDLSKMAEKNNKVLDKLLERMNQRRL